MMKKSTVIWIISSVGLALAALIGVQIYWAFNAYHLREKEFAAAVKEVMMTTANELNKELACFELFSKTRINGKEGFYIAKQKWENDQFIPGEPADTVPMFFANANESLPFEWKNLMFGSPVNVRMVLTFDYLSEDPSSISNPVNRLEKVTQQNYREAFSEHKPIEKLFPPEVTDSLLRKNLKAASIEENYRFGFVRSDLNRLDYPRNSADSATLLASDFRLPITQSPYFSQPYELRLVFDNYSQMILAGIKKLLIGSAAVIFILLLSFYLFARIILKQRKLSEMKNDFINNMTHEFKTPLTNISLALENMAGERVARNEREENVLKIIGQEAIRLRENVDRILQVARFEKEKLHLSREQVDVHQLIQKTVSAFDPLLNGHGNGTSIHCVLDAANPLIQADETLLFNAIYNVIDNGIRYNTLKPEITVSTGMSRGGVAIRIRDNGIGIAAGYQKKIFENFFRVPQGNLHDVKGYGLGLSYVKLIVEAHHGEVSVQSQPGQGSEFQIYIPSAS